MMWWGWGKCMGVLEGIVRLDLSLGEGLDGGGGEENGASAAAEGTNGLV